MNRFAFFFALAFFLFSCGKGNEASKDKKELIALHQAQREYHFSKNASAFVNQFSNHYIAINDGLLTRPSKEELLDQFQEYFAAVDFKKWDDLNEPIIEISGDGTLAYMLV